MSDSEGLRRDLRSPAIIITVHRHHVLPTPLITIYWSRAAIPCTRKRFKWYKMQQQTDFVPLKTFPRYQMGNEQNIDHNPPTKNT